MDDKAAAVPSVAVTGAWDWAQAVFGTQRSALTAALTDAIAARRWFGAKTRTIERLEIIDAAAFSDAWWLLLVEIHFESGPSEHYQVPLGFAADGSGHRVAENARLLQVAATSGEKLGTVYDALADAEFCGRLLAAFAEQQTLSGRNGRFAARRTERFDALAGPAPNRLPPRLVQAEQSNSSVIYGDRLILKIFRRVERGSNPDFEISEFLSRQGFAHTPAMAGLAEYHADRGEPWDLAMLQAFVPNQGDAWQFTLAWLADALGCDGELASRSVPPPQTGLVRAAEQPLPAAAQAACGEFLRRVELLGRRTAEMHLALSADARDPAFAPEPFLTSDRRRYFGAAAALAADTWELLRRRMPHFAPELAAEAQRVLALAPAAARHFDQLASEGAHLDKIRCHGDYHLGQVLVTADDFVIIDFEGEPARPFDERRRKQLALRDVAGMIRSLHYASCAAGVAARARRLPADAVDAWTAGWYGWTSAAFLAAYRRTAGAAGFLPGSRGEFERLLGGCLLEKAIYELRYELNNRPDWVHLPLAALAELLAAGA